MAVQQSVKDLLGAHYILYVKILLHQSDWVASGEQGFGHNTINPLNLNLGRLYLTKQFPVLGISACFHNSEKTHKGIKCHSTLLILLNLHVFGVATEVFIDLFLGAILYFLKAP